MKIGISITSRHANADARTGGRWMVERAAAAYAAGLDSLSVGDHHVTPENYFQNTPVLGRLLAEWPDRPAGCLFLVPLWHPVLMAEQIGTLAALAGGPFIVQTGIGYGDDQFDAFGASQRTRGREIDTRVPLVQSLLAGEPGPTGSGVRPIPPEPVTWWVGGGKAGLDRAARLGDCWYSGPALTPAQLEPLMDAYQQACATHDRNPRVVARKDVLVLPDAAEAEQITADLLAAGYRGLSREQLVVGDPQQVAAQLSAFADLGVEEVAIRCMAVPQEMALETIRGMGEVRSMLAS